MKNKSLTITKHSYNKFLADIANIISQARNRIAHEINNTQTVAYWHIGRMIVEYEQQGRMRAVYGDTLIKRLSYDMTIRFGRGFSETNLKMMRLFYQSFPIRQTASDEFVVTPQNSR